MSEAQRRGPKVLGVGFHKTGTSSLGAALGRLGHRVAGPFGVRDPDIATHAWPEARRRLERVDAVQDNPWPLLFRELDEYVPDARFVLTLRDEDAWWASVLAHFGGVSTPMREWIYGEGNGDPVGNEAVYRERYRAHEEQVRAHFADRPGDLLVLSLDAGDGWPELCRFLDEPIPSGEFPHANRGGRARTALNRARARLRAIRPS
ncbi:MAG: sulfotransferase family protein [Actinomycetota bacterium]